MTRSFYQDTVTRYRAPLVDDGHGNVVEDWGAASSTGIAGCRWQPVSSEEALQNRDGSEVVARLLAPSTADIAARDRVEFDGVTYEVEGEPLRHRSPRGVAAHAEVHLRRFDG